MEDRGSKEGKIDRPPSSYSPPDLNYYKIIAKAVQAYISHNWNRRREFLTPTASASEFPA